MMKVNWNHLRDVHTRLSKQYRPNDPITFHYTPTGYGKKKNTVKFESFMKIFWNLYDTTVAQITSVIVTDAKTDAIIYKHRPAAIVSEKKPEGDGHFVSSWNLLPQDRKSVLMRILLSQIKSTTP